MHILLFLNLVELKNSKHVFTLFINRVIGITDDYNPDAQILKYIHISMCCILFISSLLHYLDFCQHTRAGAEFTLLIPFILLWAIFPFSNSSFPSFLIPCHVKICGPVAAIFCAFFFSPCSSPVSAVLRNYSVLPSTILHCWQAPNRPW